jgi:mannose-6-phosphate isomerase-like protein (cupin superfamily)
VSSVPAPAAATLEQQGRRSLNRIGDGELIEMSNHTLRYLSTDLLRKQVTPILTEYRARTLEEFGELMRHAGEEFLFVLEGAVELHTELYSPVVLKAGESVYFDSRMGHAYLAHGPGPCRALSICVAPQEEIRKVHDAVSRTGTAVDTSPAKRIAPITKQRRRRTG